MTRTFTTLLDNNGTLRDSVRGKVGLYTPHTAARQSDFKSARLLQILPSTTLVKKRSVIMADFVMDNEDDFLTNQDPHPYLFEPEHTEEELQVLEEERARERLRLLNSQELRRDSELA